jgi:hypothetical protein
MRGKNQNNLSGVNLNMKHDEASSLKSPNGSSVGKRSSKKIVLFVKSKDIFVTVKEKKKA